MKKHIQKAKNIKAQTQNHQEKLNNLTEDQKLVLLDLVVRKIQLDISKNKSLIKDFIDGGLGLLPFIGDITQIIFSIQLIWSMQKQLKQVDYKVLFPIILLTLLDVATGLLIGSGDLADFALTTNFFIQKYIEKLYIQAQIDAQNSKIDPELINFVTKNSKKTYQILKD